MGLFLRKRTKCKKKEPTPIKTLTILPHLEKSLKDCFKTMVTLHTSTKLTLIGIHKLKNETHSKFLRA